MIAYQTAYLKANYPEAFMAALMSADQNNIDRITIEINECHKMGIQVLQPDVNESFSKFAVVENEDSKNLGKIRFGLIAIKNVGQNIAKVIIQERKDNGPYKTLEDFLNRIKDKDLNKKSLESLIKSGAFDSFLSRGQALGNINTIIEYNKKIQNDHKSGQNNLFADLPLAGAVLSLKLDEYPDIASEQKLSWEKELIGLYLSSHPFKECLQLLKDKVTPLNRLKNKEGTSVKVAGTITHIQKIITHKGKAMLFVTIDDSIGSVELLVFPKTLETTFGIWQDESKVMVQGKVSEKDGQPKILTETATIITEEYIKNIKAGKHSNKKLWIILPGSFTKDKMDDLKKILENKPGKTSVYLEIHNGKVRKIKTNLKVLPDQQLQEEIVEFLDQSAWRLENK